MGLLRTGSMTVAVTVGALALASSGCGGPQPVRGEEVEGLDDEAFSTGLDRRDLQKMLHENMEALQQSAHYGEWQERSRDAALAAYRMTQGTRRAHGSA